VQAVMVSGILGMAFLIALTLGIDDIRAISEDPSPVAAILKTFFGQAEALPLIWMCISIFACGTIIMTTNGRLIWAMARDRRFPGHQLLAWTPRTTGGPIATAFGAFVSATIVVVLRSNTEALFTLFTASTLMPAILYAGTVLLYIFKVYRRGTMPEVSRLGRWETPVVFGAMIWLAYELIVLLAPADFRAAQRYALGAVAIGGAVRLLLHFLEPSSIRRAESADEWEVTSAEQDEESPAAWNGDLGEAMSPANLSSQEKEQQDQGSHATHRLG
jgi:amino acid transporter